MSYVSKKSRPSPYATHNYGRLCARHEGLASHMIAKGLRRCAGREANENNGHSHNGETKHLGHGGIYGNRVGVFRLMEVLDRYGIRAPAPGVSKACCRPP